MNFISGVFVLIATVSSVNICQKNKQKSCPNCDVVHKAGECIDGTKTIDFKYTYEKEANKSIKQDAQSSDYEYFIPINSNTNNLQNTFYDYTNNAKLINDYEYFQNLRSFGCNSKIAIDDDGDEQNGKDATPHFPDNYFCGDFVGVCGYVAVQMLLSYYNTYFFDNIVSESNSMYGNNYVPFDYTLFNETKKPDFSPGSDHEFLRRLYMSGPSSSNILENPRLFQFPWMIPDIIGSWLLMVRNTYSDLDFLMNTNGISKLTKDEMNTIIKFMIFGDFVSAVAIIASHFAVDSLWQQSFIKTAKEKIDNNVPVILTFCDPTNIKGLSHIVVCYGYTNDGRFIVNTGWGANNLIIKDINKNSSFLNINNDHPQRISFIDEKYLVSCTSLDISFPHIDANNHIYSYFPSYRKDSCDYLNPKLNAKYCSCGKEIYESQPLYFSKRNFDLTNEYEKDEKILNIIKNGINTQINVLRCGYIEEKYLALSAKRKGFGVAYISFSSEMKMRALKWDMALWGQSESLKLNSSIRIDIFDNGEWVADNLFLYNDFSKSKDYLKSYCHYFSKETTKFRIIIETNEVNNENNRGRIVFDNFYLYGAN